MTPFMPRTTENVYTIQVTIKIPMVIHLELSTWSRLAAVWLISGVARLKVVAVPANRAKTAKRSMRRPGACLSGIRESGGRPRNISVFCIFSHGA